MRSQSSRIVPAVVSVLGLVTLAAFADAAPAAGEPARIRMTAAPVTVDGVLDEPCWQGAETVRVEYAYGKLGARSESLPAGVRFAWDKDYLYVAYETFDANLLAAGTGEQDGPKHHLREACDINGSNDVFEVFVSFSDPNFFWELHHNALNQFSDIWVTVAPSNSPFARSSRTYQGILWSPREYLNEGEGDTVKMATAVQLKPAAEGKPSTVNRGDDRDTGYVAELRLPWKALGAPSNWLGGKPNIHGSSITLFCAVQNGDLTPRYHHTSPNQKITGFFHQAAPDWPCYLLVDPAKETGGK